MRRRLRRRSTHGHCNCCSMAWISAPCPQRAPLREATSGVRPRRALADLWYQPLERLRSVRHVFARDVRKARCIFIIAVADWLNLLEAALEKRRFGLLHRRRGTTAWQSHLAGNRKPRRGTATPAAVSIFWSHAQAGWSAAVRRVPRPIQQLIPMPAAKVSRNTPSCSEHCHAAEWPIILERSWQAIALNSSQTWRLQFNCLAEAPFADLQGCVRKGLWGGEAQLPTTGCDLPGYIRPELMKKCRRPCEVRW